MRAPGTTVLAAALAFTCIGARAQGAAVEKTKSIGKSAATSFAGSATVTCADGSTASVSAFGFLFAAEQITQETGTPKTVSNGVTVDVFFYSNECTGTFLSASGGFADGFTPPNKWLNSAGMQGTTSLQDFSTGAEIPVALDIVIEGTGPLSASKSSDKTKAFHPLVITISRTSNANRSGTASGTMSIDGVPLDLTFSDTTLTGNANVEITIEKKK